MRKVLLVTLLLILVLCAATPSLVGYQIKKNLYAAAAGFSEENSNFSIAIQDYQWGWLSSDATLEIRFKIPPNTASDSPGEAPKTITETLHSHILHGPLIQEPSGRFILALALIQTRAWLADFNYTSSAKDHAIGEIITEIDFKNNWHSQYSQPTLDFQLGKLVKAHMQAAQGNFDFTLRDNQITTYRFDIAANEVSVVLPSTAVTEVTTNGLRYENAFQKTPAGVWTGTAKMTLPILVLKDKDNAQTTIQEAQFVNTIDNPHASFYDFGLRIRVKNVQTSAKVIPIIGPAELTIAADHLNLEGVQALSVFFKSIHHQTMSEEERKTYFNLLPKLLTPTTLVSENLEAMTSDGKLQNEARFSWKANPAPPSNPQEMLQKVNTSISLRIANTLVDKIIALHDGEAATSTTPAATTTNTATPPATATPAVESTTIAATPAAVPAQQPPAPPSFKAILDAWLAKGYVVKEGNDYVVVIKHEDGVTTINGKPPTPPAPATP